MVLLYKIIVKYNSAVLIIILGKRIFQIAVYMVSSVFTQLCLNSGLSFVLLLDWLCCVVKGFLSFCCYSEVEKILGAPLNIMQFKTTQKLQM